MSYQAPGTGPLNLNEEVESTDNTYTLEELEQMGRMQIQETSTVRKIEEVKRGREVDTELLPKLQTAHQEKIIKDGSIGTEITHPERPGLITWDGNEWIRVDEVEQ